MADHETDTPNTPLTDDPAINKGLSAKHSTASHPARAEPGLDTLFHRTDSRFCCTARLQTRGASRRRVARYLFGNPCQQQSFVRRHRRPGRTG